MSTVAFSWLFLALGAWTAQAPPQEAEVSSSQLERLDENGRQAAEALARCRRYLHGWLAEADAETGLIPTNLASGRDLWTAANSAADNYPFLVLSAALTDRDAFAGPLREMLRTETRITARRGPLPDDWSFSRKGFRHDQPDLGRMLFGASEYVKDGLLPLTEWLGQSPWSERMLVLLDAIWAEADFETPFGPLPTRSVEVHGEMLQTLSRVYWLTGDPEHLQRAVRIADYYLQGDGQLLKAGARLRLRDHGCEVVSGLCELYVTLHFADPERKERYREPLHELLDRVLAVGRNEDGLFCDEVELTSGARRMFSAEARASDSFGYTLNGYYAVYLVDGTDAYRGAVRQALAALDGKYRDHPWEGQSADGYADAIEGALNLYNREPLASTASWIDSEIQVMWAKQQGSGIIEGWHGDGNFARTSLLYALWKTQGVTTQPWRQDLKLGAVREGDRLLLQVACEDPWEGVLVFDRPRHRSDMKLPLDWPRINQFPEWFTVEAERRYLLLRPGASQAEELSGAALSRGLPVELAAGERRVLIVQDTP